MKKIFYIIMILLAPKMISAATYYVIKNGNWSSGTFSTSLGGASCGCTPNSSDIVIIPSPYTLTVNFDFTIGTGAGNISTLTIQSGGSFDVSNKNLFVKSGGTLNIYGTLKRAADVQFSNGSVVNTYSGSTFTVTGNFQNNNSSTGITFNGSMTVAGSFTNGVNAIISGTTGTISVNGSVTNNGTTFGGAACSPSPCTFSGGTILPIELISFTAQPKQGIVKLDWITATELNNDYFTVERTKDGKTFEIVTKVIGFGNSNSTLSYSYSDAHPTEGVSYYRLKQTDFNGNFTYSNLVSVDFNGNSDLSFSVYPNPADGASLINLSLTTAKGQEVLVQIYDVTGKESYENRFLVKDNSEQIYAIELSQQLSPGIYLMMLTADQKRFSNKLIVK